MGLEATTFSLKTDNPADWLTTQYKLQLDHREALYRIQNYYNTAINETIHNSQMNLVKYISRNSDLFISNSYDNVTQAVQTALQLVAHNKEWFVQVYEDKAEYDIYQASRCVDCFSIFNVNGSYNIFVAGVDINSLPNPAI